MIKIGNNLTYEHWQERLSKITQDQRDQITQYVKGEDFIKLIKPDKESVVKVGDVFVLSPMKDVYFFGKVFEAHTQGFNPNHHEYIALMVKHKSNNKDISNFKADYSNILLGPEVVCPGFWTGGYFEIIDNIPLTKEERKLDYGFFTYDFDYKTDQHYGYFIQANGKGSLGAPKLKHIPKYYSQYGSGGTYDKLKAEFIIDPTIIGEPFVPYIKPQRIKKPSEFDKQIKPFTWAGDEGSYQLMLDTSLEYKKEVFDKREDDGFCGGSGGDWDSLAKVFIKEKMPKLEDNIEFDSEAGMFNAYSESKTALQKFALAFKEMCENDKLINDLFSRAELD